MPLTPEQFAAVERHFHDLDGLPTARQITAIAVLRKSEPAVADEVERLLAGSTEIASQEVALDGLVVDLGAETPDPAQIGPYRIVRRLGEGGMGRVYEAEQSAPMTRRVALKVMRPGLGSGSMLARFARERQALAVMEHTAIARVFDAGTATDGQPWVAMELVEGVPITEYVANRDLGIDQLLGLFLPVCDAVQHAHTKGVIHRDLKPSNILVAEQDGAPTPKIIDFGIAKAVDGPAIARTLATGLGELVGTIEYMSPEQAALGAVDIDTRSDVYALGLVLYQLMTDSLPLSPDTLRAYPFDEMCRRIREDPVRLPSQGTGGSRRVDADLERVVLKALAKDREQRYASAADLAADLRRYLADEPVLATPPTWQYRLRTFVRRHRVAVIVALVMGMALTVGLGAAVVGLVRARAAEREALVARTTAERTTDFLLGLFKGSDPRANPGLDLTARTLLERGTKRLDALDDEPAVEAQMLESLGDVYVALAGYDEAQPLLERALALRAEGPAADPVREAMILSRLGGLLRARADLTGAEAAYRRALVALESHGIVESLEVGSVLNDLGIVLRQAQRLDEAASVYERSRSILVPLERAPSENQASIANNLAMVYTALGRHDDAAAAAREGLVQFRGLLPEGHPNLGILEMNLATIERRRGALAAAAAHAAVAVAILRAALPEDHPDVADALQALGMARLHLGQIEGAEVAYRAAGDIFAANLGAGRFRSLNPRAALGTIALFRGDVTGARAAVESVLSDGGALERPGPIGFRLAWLRQASTAARLDGDFDAAAAYTRTLFTLADAEGRTIDAARARLGMAILEAQRSATSSSTASSKTTGLTSTGSVSTGPVETEHSERTTAAEWLAEAEVLAGNSEPSVLDDPSTGIFRAAYWAHLGALDQTFEALERAVRHPGRSAWIRLSPDLAPIRDDPRWAALDTLLGTLSTNN